MVAFPPEGRHTPGARIQAVLPTCRNTDARQGRKHPESATPPTRDATATYHYHQTDDTSHPLGQHFHPQNHGNRATHAVRSYMPPSRPGPSRLNQRRPPLESQHPGSEPRARAARAPSAASLAHAKWSRRRKLTGKEKQKSRHCPCLVRVRPEILTVWPPLTRTSTAPAEESFSPHRRSCASVQVTEAPSRQPLVVSATANSRWQARAFEYSPQ
jgi:hypothetical protein